MQSFWRFLSYNNAVPIALSFMTLSFGAAFASSEEVRESVFASSEKVVAIDNTYIVGKDLSTYSPQIQITGVTEDADHYFVAYTLTTIDIVDSVWRDVTKEVTLKVAKSVLGEDLDLGLYATRQLAEVAAAELARLRETQTYEKRVVSQKVVATEYSGLIGRFLDPKTKMLPGYVPVVTPRESEPTVVAAAAASAEPQSQTHNVPSQQPATPPAPTAPGAPTLQVLGANPARIPVGASYIDLGVLVIDPPENDASVTAYVNGSDFPYAVGALTIDTIQDGEWKIRYVATDKDGNTAEAERIVIVGNPQPPQDAEMPVADDASSTAPSSTGSRIGQ